MPANKQHRPSDYIDSLYINGMQGRMLRMRPPKGKKREFLLIYGHHASLERLFGLAQSLNDYGGVTMPDLPGFGGMQSFYKIGEKPTLDNLADYLAAFVKLRYRNRRFSIAAVSFGFVVVTRMLQKYPDIAKRVDLLVSIVGFAHRDEFTFSRPRYLFYRYGASFFSHRLPAIFFRNVILHPSVLRTFYSRTHNAKHKFANVAAEELRQITDFEIYLWHCNDVRTYMHTTVSLLTIDNCRVKVDLPVWHVSVKEDNYFDNRIIEQHMKVIFNDFHDLPAKLDSHSISIIADKKASAPFIPTKLRNLLRQEPIQ